MSPYQKVPHSVEESGPPSNSRFPGPKQIHFPIGVSAGLAFFAQLARVPNTQTERYTCTQTTLRARSRKTRQHWLLEWVHWQLGCDNRGSGSWSARANGDCKAQLDRLFTL